MFGNLKQQEILRPSVIGNYFSKSNVIDVGNGLHHNELALERHWRTLNPWFRVICTVIGISVIDAYLAAKYQAPSCSGIDNMGVRDWSMHMVYDLWNREVSREPKSVVIGETSLPPTAAPNSVSEGEGDEVVFVPKTFEDIMCDHEILTTDQRKGNSNDGKGQLVRRQCHIKADGCKGQCSTECYHRACRRKRKGAINRFDATEGTFICQNVKCRSKHFRDMMALAN